MWRHKIDMDSRSLIDKSPKNHIIDEIGILETFNRLLKRVDFPEFGLPTIMKLISLVFDSSKSINVCFFICYKNLITKDY